MREIGYKMAVYIFIIAISVPLYLILCMSITKRHGYATSGFLLTFMGGLFVALSGIPVAFRLGYLVVSYVLFSCIVVGVLGWRANSNRAN